MGIELEFTACKVACDEGPTSQPIPMGDCAAPYQCCLAFALPSTSADNILKPTNMKL